MIYVLSDIHGHKRRFDSIMEQINLQLTDTLYVLGDVIDRNFHGISILHQLMSMQNVKMILGNHEYMMLDALYFPHDEWQRKNNLALWYQNGGCVTHLQISILPKDVQAEIMTYLVQLPLNREVVVNGKQYILVHAAPVALYEKHHHFKSEIEFSLWHRFKGSEQYPCDATIIFGHTVTFLYQDANPAKIWYGNGLIGIDCGAAYGDEINSMFGCRNRLACLRLDDMKEFYSEE